MYALAGAVVVAMASGWVRGLVLPPLSDPLIAVPWSWLRRILLGLAYDLPAAVTLCLACLLVGRFMSLRPVRSALALVGLVWALDALVAALVSHDMRLWADPFVLAGRSPVVAGALFASAKALGRGRPPAAEDEEGGDDDDPSRAAPVEDEPSETPPDEPGV